jgi:Transposase, Mutator family
MERDSRSASDGKGSLEELLRERIRDTIELIVEQELEEALGAANSQRVGEQRAGYRHGHRARTLSTSLGATTIAMPRARTLNENGRRHEWRSQIIPRYQRRTARVDEAILGGVPKRHQYATVARSAGAAAARCTVVEGRGIASGRTPARRFCGLGRARSQRAEGSLSVPGRLVSASANRQGSGCGCRCW